MSDVVHIIIVFWSVILFAPKKTLPTFYQNNCIPIKGLKLRSTRYLPSLLTFIIQDDCNQCQRILLQHCITCATIGRVYIFMGLKMQLEWNLLKDNILVTLWLALLCRLKTGQVISASGIGSCILLTRECSLSLLGIVNVSH